MTDPCEPELTPAETLAALLRDHRLVTDHEGWLRCKTDGWVPEFVGGEEPWYDHLAEALIASGRAS